MANLPVVSFNAGHMTPKIDTRSDTEKYSSGCRIIENMLPLIYGPAERRPGTEYIATAKNSPQGVRLIAFIYSATIAYIVEFGDLYARFYFDGARVLSGVDIVEIVTPFLVADLPQVQYDQSADVMWLVHSSYPQQKLSRTTASSFSMDRIIFTKGPFLERNDIAVEDDVTMTSSVTAADAAGTLTASSATFETGHIGSIWKLTHKREASVVKGSASGTGVIDAAIDVKGAWTFTTHGNWDATIEIQRNEDGTNWETFRSYTSVITNSVGSRNVQKTDIEETDGVQYRMNVTEYTSGTVEADFTVNDPTLDGIVRIDTVASSVVANITVLSKVASTDATKRWAEGAWSGVRGYPTSFTLFEERAVYANGRRIWLSSTGKFEDFAAGTTDSDSFALDVPTANTIRWVASLDALMVGTSGDEWRIRATTLDAALTPDNWEIKQQTARGCRNIQALKVNEAVLFVDFVGRKVRELTFRDEQQKFVSPDLTALAEDITETGITSLAHQRNPDSIVWFTLANGRLLSMTYEREQNVVAWAKHLIGLSQVDTTTVDTETTSYAELICTNYPYPGMSSEPADTALSGETEITTKAGLQAITGSGHYEIMNDIDASGSWTPINNFSGVLEGNNFTISNLTVDGGNSDEQGMFAALGVAEIRNLVLEDFTINGGRGVAALAGQITNNTSGLVIKDVNVKNATITSEATAWTITGAGGLIGECDLADDFLIIRCTVEGSNIDAYEGGAGGLIGYINNKTSQTATNKILECFAKDTTVTVRGNLAGGLVGFIDGHVDYYFEVHSCYTENITIGNSTGSETDCNSCGGLIGKITRANVTNCYSKGVINIDVTTQSNSDSLGGFAGEIRDSNIVNCYADVDITSEESAWSVGGFVGTVIVTTDNLLGHCYSLGDITLNLDGNAEYGSVGGFVGTHGSVFAADGGLIEQCWSKGNIYLAEGASVNDLLDAETGDGYDLYAGVGGFFGGGQAFGVDGMCEYFPDVTNCYTTTSITVGDNIVACRMGGFGGLFSAISGDWAVTNCYSSGSLPSNAVVTGQLGGFIGKNDSATYDIVATACFWDTDTSGVTADYSTGAVGHITQWMLTKSNFEDAGWDFDTIWKMTTNYIQQEATGTVESVATIPGEDEDEVWIAVLRAINGSTARFIERMKPRNWGDDQADCFFVDSGLSYDGTATDTFSGLDHLEGETVAVLGDGAVYATEVVLSGSITIRDSVEKAHVGLPFRYRLKPMRLDVMTPSGTTLGKIKKISKMTISFLNTLYAQYGDGVDTRSIDWRTTEVYDTPPALFTGMKKVIFDGGFSNDDPILISGEDPLPCSVRAIVPQIEKTEV